MNNQKTSSMRTTFTASFFGANALLSALAALGAFVGNGQAATLPVAFAWSSSFLGWSAALLAVLALRSATRNAEGDE